MSELNPDLGDLGDPLVDIAIDYHIVRFISDLWVISYVAGSSYPATRLFSRHV